MGTPRVFGDCRRTATLGTGFEQRIYVRYNRCNMDLMWVETHDGDRRMLKFIKLNGTYAVKPRGDEGYWARRGGWTRWR